MIDTKACDREGIIFAIYVLQQHRSTLMRKRMDNNYRVS